MRKTAPWWPLLPLMVFWLFGTSGCAAASQPVGAHPERPTVALPLTVRLASATEAARASTQHHATRRAAYSVPSAPKATPHPTRTPSPDSPCLLAAAPPHMDITIPDGTVLRPGQAFTKVWRLRNDGSCTWTPDFAVVWFAGARMGAPQTVALGRTVPPGSTVDIAVDMIAPTQPGTYTSYWKLRADDGSLFGLGPGHGAPFWVLVEIRPKATPSPTLPPTTTPTPTITPTPAVQAQAELLLQPEQTLDLDRLAPHAAGGDLRYAVDRDGVHWLHPQGAALLGVFGNLRPSSTDCAQSNLAAAPLPLESLSHGVFLCYRTDEGRWGRLRLLELTAEGALRLEAVTWAGEE